MAREPSLDEVRRHFAEELRVVSHLGSERLVEAFAAVPRERFAGPGPWRLLHDGDGYWSTPDANPHWLYHNVLVALDEKRRLNIGGPSLWAFHFDRIGVRQGERVLQIGAGSGYYTAILAELAGPRGHVDALEIDEDLAEAARRNLEDRPDRAGSPRRRQPAGRGPMGRDPGLCRRRRARSPGGSTRWPTADACCCR